MRALGNLITFTLALAVATVLVGWWAVPVVAALWTILTPRRAAVIYAAFAGAMSWASLLMLQARGGPVGAVDRLVAQLLNVPGRTLIVLTLLYAALLAGSAALLAQALRPARAKRPETRAQS